MIIQGLSDTHGQHQTYDRYIQEGSLLFLLGDFDCDNPESLRKFMEWVKKQALKQKLGVVITGGNHDTELEKKGHELQTSEYWKQKIFYLNNDFLDLDGLKIFGSPNVEVLSKGGNPKYLAFADLFSELSKTYSKIPEDLDFLLTHTPPRNTLDGYFGSTALANKLTNLKLKPKLHLFGHCHEKFGHEYKENIHYFNVACNGSFDKGPYLPTIIDYDTFHRQLIAYGQYEMDIT